MTTLDREIAELRKAINRMNSDSKRWTRSIETIGNNFGSTAPVTNALNGLTQKMSSVVNPFQKVAEAFTKADETQKQMLGLNTDLITFTKQNADNLKNLRGGFLENAEELFKNFSEGLRFNSDGMNLLQNRMRLTGQDTNKLREATKILFNAVGGNVDSINKLSKTNVELGRNYMVSNEKLLDALSRNEDVLDYTSIFGMSEKTAEQIMKLTGMMESKGISVKNQNQVVKLLTSSDQKTAEMRVLLGLGYDANERLLDGQDSVERLLKVGADFANQNLIQQKGFGKMMNTNNVLQGLGGDELKNTVVALTQTNKILSSNQKDNKQFQSKEDKFYNTFENYAKESSNWIQTSLVNHYPLMEMVPKILETMQRAQAGGMAGGLISDITSPLQEARSSKILSGKMDLADKKEILKQALADRRLNPGQAANDAVRDAIKDVRKATNVVSKAVGGPIMRGLFGALRFAGPVGMIAGTLLPLLPDMASMVGQAIDWFKGDDSKAANENLTKEIEKLRASNQNLNTVTVAREASNKARDKILESSNDQIQKIVKVQEELKKIPGAGEQFANEAANQIKVLQQISNQARDSSLNEEALRDLQKKSMDIAEEFYVKIESNTRYGTQAVKEILNRTPKIPEKTEEKRIDVNDIILKSLGIALNRRTGTTKEQKELLNQMEKLNANISGMRSENRKTGIVGGDA